MDRFMGDVFRRGWMRPSAWNWPDLPPMGNVFEGRWPRVDVIDRDDEVIVNVEAPGVNKEDLDVSLGDDNVTIRAASKREVKEEKGHYFRCEIARGEFSRTIALPAAVDAAKAKASFKDGVLRLTLPKAQGAERRSIKIEAD
jgi:HSP20 family protein